jgi:hypothetical protein
MAATLGTFTDDGPQISDSGGGAGRRAPITVRPAAAGPTAGALKTRRHVGLKVTMMETTPAVPLFSRGRPSYF